jgi:hypothetical protein
VAVAEEVNLLELQLAKAEMVDFLEAEVVAVAEALPELTQELVAMEPMAR